MQDLLEHAGLQRDPDPVAADVPDCPAVPTDGGRGVMGLWGAEEAAFLRVEANLCHGVHHYDKGVWQWRF